MDGPHRLSPIDSRLAGEHAVDFEHGAERRVLDLGVVLRPCDLRDEHERLVNLHLTAHRSTKALCFNQVVETHEQLVHFRRPRDPRLLSRAVRIEEAQFRVALDEPSLLPGYVAAHRTVGDVEGLEVGFGLRAGLRFRAAMEYVGWMDGFPGHEGRVTSAARAGWRAWLESGNRAEGAPGCRPLTRQRPGRAEEDEMHKLDRVVDAMKSGEKSEALKDLLAILFMDDDGNADPDKEWDPDVFQAIGAWVEKYGFAPRG